MFYGTDRKRRAAALVGILLLVAAGFNYRAWGRWLDRAGDRVSIKPGSLAAVPLQLGAWTGRDQPLEKAMVEAADVDDHINRAYFEEGSGRGVGLFVGFGVRARDMAPHRPEVCYPGAGWNLREQQSIELGASNGAPLHARLLVFSPGGFDPRELIVVNYYLVDGESCADVSLLRSKAWRGEAAIKYVAQVQVTSRVDLSASRDNAIQAAQSFALLIAPEILTAIEKAIGENTAAETP